MISGGTPFAPHKRSEVEEMKEAIGISDIDELFDIPSEVRFTDEFGVEQRTEQEVITETVEELQRNRDVTEFLGRGCYSHYVPSIVDDISLRSEFLTSYTQYQPEVAQGFLQALFEYQSLIVDLTGLDTANSSLYDHATAIGEAALLSARARDGVDLLVPESTRNERIDVIRCYVEGADLNIEEYRSKEGDVDLNDLGDKISEDTVMVYQENPSIEGVIQETMKEVSDVAHSHDALYCIGTDPVAMSILKPPAEVNADIAVGDSSMLGLSTANGMGVGFLAADKSHLRNLPGRLVGAGRDRDGTRAYTLTLQTREQHIRKQRATSNICTNQALLALRTAIHAFSLGATGLVELGEKCIELPRKAAERIDAIDGFHAPMYDKHHFREFTVATDGDSERIQRYLLEEGIAVHALGNDKLQVCVTESNQRHLDDLVEALEGSPI